ncbi:MAG: COX15/CtaA family protein [Flavobacteriia bacterium]|nr:COX15/CtaA family protein [Flavobacteriia bacterium]
MSNYSKSFVRFNWMTLVLIFLVVIAGSFVRITGSGMGCPDWPKCFGKWIPPTQKNQLPTNYRDIFAKKRGEKIEKFSKFLNQIGFREIAQQIKEDKSILIEQSFNARKTWTEYGNRLVGFLAGNAVLGVMIWVLLKYRKRKLIFLAVLNLIFLGFEAWFGSIVVATNLVPWTITVHLFFALLIIGLQLLIINEISPRQQATIYMDNKLKWLLYFCLSVTFLQMFLGTQVRENIDEITKLGYSRELWTEKLGIPFYIHRSFSWIVLFVIIYISWMNEKSNKLWIIRSIFLTLCFELVSGILLAYANMPGLVQTSHLIFATVMLGILGMAVLRVKSVTKVTC